MAKETLTEDNIPHCPCAICMEHFHEGDIFDRTDCYHYFHRHCLGQYIITYREDQKEEARFKPKHHLNGEDEEDKVCCK